MTLAVRSGGQLALPYLVGEAEGLGQLADLTQGAQVLVQAVYHFLDALPVGRLGGTCSGDGAPLGQRRQISAAEAQKVISNLTFHHLHLLQRELPQELVFTGGVNDAGGRVAVRKMKSGNGLRLPSTV